MKKISNINVIAEVGLAHEGSMTLAMSYIDRISEAGADAVKFQTHIANSESTEFDKFRIKSKYVLDKNRLEYWQRTSFTKDQWKISDANNMPCRVCVHLSILSRLFSFGYSFR